MKRAKEKSIRDLLAQSHHSSGVLAELYFAASDLAVEVDILRAALTSLHTSAAARRQLDRDWDARDVPVSCAGEVRLEKLDAAVDAALAHAEKVLRDG